MLPGVRGGQDPERAVDVRAVVVGDHPEDLGGPPRELLDEPGADRRGVTGLEGEFREPVRGARTPDQKRLLLELVDEWIRPLNGGQAAAKLAAAKQNLDSTTFAWYGSTTIGQPIYYRVQGPTFVIEFAHQQGGGPNAGGITHIHSIYREPGNDYGAQLTS